MQRLGKKTNSVMPCLHMIYLARHKFLQDNLARIDEIYGKDHLFGRILQHDDSFLQCSTQPASLVIKPEVYASIPLLPAVLADLITSYLPQHRILRLRIL